MEKFYCPNCYIELKIYADAVSTDHKEYLECRKCGYNEFDDKEAPLTKQEAGE